MSSIQIIFIIIAAITLGAALMVVTVKKLLHSAIWLIVSLFGVAIFYVLLDAEFLAVAQLVVYIGAIAILMIFAIMLTRRIAAEPGSQVNREWPWAFLISLLFFGGVIWLLSSWDGINIQFQELSARADPIRDLGISLVSPNAYVIPFELASVLLLAALVGAIVVSWPRKKGQG